MIPIAASLSLIPLSTLASPVPTSINTLHVHTSNLTQHASFPAPRRRRPRQQRLRQAL